MDAPLTYTWLLNGTWMGEDQILMNVIGGEEYEVTVSDGTCETSMTYTVPDTGNRG